MTAAIRDARNAEQNVCPPQSKMPAAAPLGGACPAPLPRPPPPPEPEQPITSPRCRYRALLALCSPQPRYSHIAPLARAAARKPIPLPGPSRPACPAARRTHSTSAGPTPQRPAARGGARQPLSTANAPAGRRPRCTPGGTPAPPWCLPGNVVLVAGRRAVRANFMARAAALAVGWGHLSTDNDNKCIITCKYSAISTYSATCYCSKKRTLKTADTSAARSR